MASTADSRLRRRILLLCVPCCLAQPAMLHAADWKWAARLSLAERYSDNVYLRPKGLEHSDWITEVSPGLSVRREGRRLKVDVDYGLQGYLYADDTDRSRVRHTLNGQAKAELLHDWFFLDASARAAQELIDYISGIGLGDAAGLHNTRQVYGYSLSPYLKHRFGADATVELRVRRDEYFANGGGGLSDSSANSFSFNAQSGNNFFPLSWRVAYDKRKTDYDQLADNDSEQGSASARLQVRQGFGLTAQASRQRNDFPGATNRLRDYAHYGLGFFYTPSRRLSAELAHNWSDYGDFVSGNLTLRPTLRTTLTASSTQRNFGRSHSLSLNHRTRKTNWGLVYREGLTSYDQQFFARRFDVWLCPNGLTLSPPDTAGCRALNDAELRALFGGAVFVPINLHQTYVDKGWTGLFNYELRRATISLSLFDSRQQYRGAGAQGREDRRTGVQGAVSLRPGERTTLTLSSGITHLEVDDPNNPGNTRSDDYWNIGLTLTRRFLPDVNGSLEVRHQQRDSDLGAQDYKENSVAARLNMRF